MQLSELHSKTMSQTNKAGGGGWLGGKETLICKHEDMNSSLQHLHKEDTKHVHAFCPSIGGGREGAEIGGSKELPGQLA